MGFCENYLKSEAYMPGIGENCPGEGWLTQIFYGCPLISPYNYCDILCKQLKYKDSCAIRTGNCPNLRERMCLCRNKIEN